MAQVRKLLVALEDYRITVVQLVEEEQPALLILEEIHKMKVAAVAAVSLAAVAAATTAAVVVDQVI